MAFFSLEPDNKIVKSGESFEVKLNIDTEGKETVLAETLVSFNNNILEVKEVNNGNFYPSLSKNISDGELYVGAYVSDINNNSRSGKGTMASITFAGKTQGSSPVKFKCLPASFSESNITAKDKGFPDIINCDKNISGLYTVENVAGYPLLSHTDISAGLPNLFLTSVLLAMAFIVIMVIITDKRGKMLAKKAQSILESLKIHVFWAIGVIALFFLILSLAFFLSFYSKNSTPVQITPTPSLAKIGKIAKQEEKRIYYVKDKSIADDFKIEIYSASSRGDNIKLEGTISERVKQISPAGSNRFLAIDNLGFLERGKNISLFEAKTNQWSNVLTPPPDMAIESYVLLPDKKSLIVWLVEEKATTYGRSQIAYKSIDNLTPAKILLDGQLSDKTPYPIFFSQATKRVYFDTYSVNRLGIYRGILSIDLEGGNLQDEPALSLNQYSSLPVADDSGSRIIYTSYSPDSRLALPQPQVPNQILRTQVRNPNRINMLDLLSGQVRLLHEDLKGKIFDNLVWYGENEIIFRSSQILPDGSDVQPLSYEILNLSNGERRILTENANGIFLSVGGQLLFAVRTPQIEGLGGLGTPYSPVLTGVYLFNPIDGAMEKILTDEPIQIIN